MDACWEEEGRVKGEEKGGGGGGGRGRKGAERVE